MSLNRRIDISTEYPNVFAAVTTLRKEDFDEAFHFYSDCLYEKALEFFNLEDRTGKMDCPGYYNRGNDYTLWQPVPNGYEFVKHEPNIFDWDDYYIWHVTTDLSVIFTRDMETVCEAMDYARRTLHNGNGQAQEEKTKQEEEKPPPSYDNPTPELLEEVDQLIKEIENDACWEDATDTPDN